MAAALHSSTDCMYTAQRPTDRFSNLCTRVGATVGVSELNCAALDGENVGVDVGTRQELHLTGHLCLNALYLWQ